MKYFKLFEEYSPESTLVKSGDINTPGGLVIKLVDQSGKAIGNVNIEVYDSGRVTDPDLEEFHQTTEGLPFTNANAAYLHTLNVDPEHRRMGHGSTLIKGAEDSAREAGRGYMTAIVSKENTNSQGLFKKFGYDTIIDNEIKDLLHKNISNTGSV